jgi:hypothetical protein
MKSVGAAVLEIQLVLCRRGGKGRMGQGSGPKGYVIGAYDIFDQGPYILGNLN